MTKRRHIPMIYVAGPFRAKTPWVVEQGVRVAEECAHELILAGAFPVIPHAIGRYFHKTGSSQFWLNGTMQLMRLCDAVVLCGDWENSQGACAERDEALRLNMPVWCIWKREQRKQMHKWIKQYKRTGITIRAFPTRCG